MSSVIRIVKRGERVATNVAESAPTQSAQPSTSQMVKTVKRWIAAARERRQAKADYALLFKPGQDAGAQSQKRSILKNELAVLLLAVGLVLAVAGTTQAQETSGTNVESLTLDQAIDLALRNNHSLKIAKLAVDRVDDDISAAKTYRLPSLHAYTIVSENLAKNERLIQNPVSRIFPGFGPFFALPDARKPTAIFGAAAIQPLSQQYQIGLRIKFERLARDVEEAKLRQEQHETIDQVKKVYYSILPTHSALESVNEAVKSYQEIDMVTGDYVVQKVSLKADQLVVQTRLAKVQYEQLELSNRLATHKEQLND